MYHIQGKARRNSKTYGKFIASYETIPQVLEAIGADAIAGATSPYVFTYIQLPAERVITQTVNVGGRELTCSPTKLWEAIKAARV